MNNGKNKGRASRSGRGRISALEALEERALLTVATETFTGPSLSALIREAYDGKDTSSQVISTMLKSLETQLNAGPMADLTSGAATGNNFVSEVQNLEASFESNVDSQLLASFPNVDQIIKLQGERVVAGVVSLNEQSSVGLLTSASFASQSQTVINSLTTGPLTPLGTTYPGLASTTQDFVNRLNIVATSLGTSASPSLTAAQASSAVQAEAEAYRTAIHSALMVLHPNVSSEVDTAVDSLEETALSLANDTTSAAQTSLQTAITTFETTVYGKTGLFGTEGPVKKAGSNWAPNVTASQAASIFTTVTGTSVVGGTATLTATLNSAGSPVADKVVSFTLDGAFAGLATTDSTGVATLTGIATSDASGTDTNGVVASYAGDAGFLPTQLQGNLIVSSSSTLTSVSGTANFGGTATLLATLTANGSPVSGETVSFTLDGTSVGSATTDADGVATLTGVATTQAVGTDTGGVVATFAGNTTTAASTGTGDLVVSVAPTTLSTVAGTATVGGTATLTATLESGTTPVSGASVSFTLDGTSVGSATTSSSGIASLTGVATTHGIGTDTGGVVATYAGDSDHSSSTATGDLVVSAPSTALSAVAGSATFGGKATLVATLENSSGVGVSGATVTFTLDGTAVGSAVTSSSGVATLSGVTTTDPIGTTTGAVVASFAGNSTNAAAANANGNMVVTQGTASLASVSGTTVYGGPATLVATLTSPSSDAPIADASVTFTLDGTAVGSALTNASGVATLTGVASTDSVGTGTGNIVASFTGNTDYTAANNATGNLVVSQAPTALSAVSGSATSGGDATLLATLMNSSSDTPISGATITFTLSSSDVGTAVTNASGVATLTGVPNTEPAGTYTGVVVASYTGDSNHSAAANGTGNLVVTST